jgi:hypothetical protein
MKQSAHATVNAWNFLRRKIVDIVDAEKVLNHKIMLLYSIPRHLEDQTKSTSRGIGKGYD